MAKKISNKTIKVREYINGTQINQSKNLNGFSIDLVFDKGRRDVRTSISDVELGVGQEGDFSDGAEIVKNYVQGGIDGTSSGVYEGLPYTIEVENQNTGRIFTFEFYLDCRRAKYLCDSISIPVGEPGSVDWLENVAAGNTFEYLYLETDFLGKEHDVFAPYVINSIPQYLNAAIAAVTLYVSVTEIKNQLQMLIEYLQGVANPFEATVIIKVVTRILYVATLIVAVFNLIKQIFNLIIQPVKYHAGMYWLTQAKAAAKFLGKEFKSSVFENPPYNKIFEIPEKRVTTINDKKDGIRGWLSPNIIQQGFHKGTLLSLFEDMAQFCNGKIIVTEDEIRIERRDKNLTSSNYTIPPLRKGLVPHSFNYEDLHSNILIEFLEDFSDLNTIENYPGTTVQIITTPKSVTNEQYNLVDGLRTITVPYSRAFIKKSLTVPEKIFDLLFTIISPVAKLLIKTVNLLIKAVNKLIKLVNKIVKALKTIGIKINFELKPIKTLKVPALENLIDNRIGMMVLEFDSFRNRKLLFLNENSTPRNTKPFPNNEELMTAKTLWDEFYHIDSFVPSNEKPNGNQLKIIEPDSVQIPFCLDDLELVYDNSIIFDTEGNEGEIIAMKYYPTQNIATDIVYDISELHTKNLKQTVIVSDGQ